MVGDASELEATAGQRWCELIEREAGGARRSGQMVDVRAGYSLAETQRGDRACREVDRNAIEGGASGPRRVKRRGGHAAVHEPARQATQEIIRIDLAAVTRVGHHVARAH